MTEPEIENMRCVLQKELDSGKGVYRLTRQQLKDIVEALDTIPDAIPNWRSGGEPNKS